MIKKNYTINSDYKSVSTLVGEIKKLLELVGASPKETGEIQMCLTEALNNVVKHSYGGKPGNEIQLNISLYKERIEFEILEYGLPRKNTGKPKLEYDPNDINNLPEGGMGLFIIDKLMDSTEYSSDNGKNIFILKKNLVKKLF